MKNLTLEMQISDGAGSTAMHDMVAEAEHC